MFRISRNELVHSYKGLKIMANPFLHQKAALAINELKINKKAKILVLGSGTGAFDKRLWDLGYHSITTVDLNQQNYGFRNKNVNFISLDLNSRFSQEINVEFDLIICLEVVEHLDSPHNFIRECRKLLANRGTLIVSTPNVHGYFSRIHFLLYGYPPLFLTPPEKYGRISPIHRTILEHFLDEEGLRIRKIIPVSSFFAFVPLFSLKSPIYYLSVLITSLILAPLYLVSQNKQNGLLSIYLIGKK